MNFDKLVACIVAVVLGYAAVGQVDVLQRWIWVAQAKMLSESRTSTWGSPRFFPEPALAEKVVVKKSNDQK